MQRTSGLGTKDKLAEFYLLLEKSEGEYRSLAIVDSSKPGQHLITDDNTKDNEYWLLEYPRGRLMSTKDMNFSGVTLGRQEVRSLYRQALLSAQDQVGLLGKYFYRYKFLHYLGLAIYICLFPLCLWLVISGFRETQTVPWIYVGCLGVFTALIPQVINESKEVHDIWHKLKKLD